NRYQLLPSQQQRPLNNGTPDVRHPPLSLTAVTLIRQVTDMGFPQDRVEKAVRRLGDDDRKVLDYLCLADRLVEQHYKIDDVETSLELFENNGEKAALYLQLLTRFREMGFSDDKIQVALVGNDLDVDLATESLMSVMILWRSVTVLWRSVTILWRSVTALWRSVTVLWRSVMVLWRSVTVLWRSVTVLQRCFALKLVLTI
ncbi:hypothetical protein NP493_404g00000, partial [Ridgeia piscesae]